MAYTSPSRSSSSGTVPPSDSYLDSDVDGLTAHLKSMGIQGQEPEARHFGNVRSIAAKVYIYPTFKRPEFWTIHPWQIIPADELPPFEFPDEDLIQELAKLYINRINDLLPVLHAPSFLKSIREGLHFKDRHFGAVVLAVCAVGSRFSSDPRVFEEGSNSEQSVGWKWIRQIQPIKTSFLVPPCIYELQLYCIYVLFMNSTTTPEMCWPLISFGLRLAQDVGAHRKKPGNLKPTLESELWKRAFWMLYVIDIYVSAFLGRPRSIANEDFDVEFPIEDCDDEYWEHSDPDLAFKQPPGKPCSASYYTTFIKLMDILGYAARTIYSARRSEMGNAMGLSALEWNQKIVAELDSSLNRWVDNIPEHLTWDPKRENPGHFRQSAMLYVTYYWIQIQVHRTFIPPPGQVSVLSYPSLAICATAARACCHVVEIAEQRNAGLLALSTVVMALFNANIVLLVNVFARSLKTSTAINLGKELVDVYKSVHFLHLYEKRWEVAGRFSDILIEVLSVSRMHHQKATPPTSKRVRGAPDSLHDTSVDLFSPIEQRQTAGSNRVSAAIRAATQHEESETHSRFSLPTHSSELGSFQWPVTFDSQSWMPQDPLTSVSTETLSNPPSFDFTPQDSISSYTLGIGTYNSEGYIAPDPNSIFRFSGTQESNSLLSVSNVDDWSSYMTSVDEVIQSIWR
ncbi:hypothetical protein BT96DRAFT_884198 [Gymnopus androsaceus JB14]|uniref:Xylanolytic transcriptional activator regulatory domain-containing protein n=1 Tax=Gymnopus androsaceus JB14 TaxID=1447944 RepID=A0A6A4HJ47_9AGAR|nr:hypothetical protein BT96DRAFT_884198 [Gymnopus androsaceus JB14]